MNAVLILKTIPLCFILCIENVMTKVHTMDIYIYVLFENTINAINNADIDDTIAITNSIVFEIVLH